MITMVKDRHLMTVPSIAAPEVIQDMGSIEDLRNALFEMLEIVLSDDDLKYVTPSSSLYIVACLIRELSRDIENGLKEEKGGEV